MEHLLRRVSRRNTQLRAVVGDLTGVRFLSKLAMEDKPKLERLVSDTERNIHEKKDVVQQKIEKENESIDAEESEKPKGAGLPPTEALKLFFDRIPLLTVPGIDNAGGENLSSFFFPLIEPLPFIIKNKIDAMTQDHSSLLRTKGINCFEAILGL